MRLFREKLKFADAVDRLWAIVLAPLDRPDVANLEELAKQMGVEQKWVTKGLLVLSFFGAYFSTKFSRYNDWRCRGADLFEALIARVCDELVKRWGESRPLLPDMIADQFQIYSLSMEMASHDFSPGNLEHEIGEGFRSSLTSEPCPAAVLLGGTVFTSAAEAVFNLHSNCKLIS